MSVTALLAELHRRGIEFRIQGDRLLYRPVESVTAELHERLRRSKADLLEALRGGGDHESDSRADPDPRIERFLEDDNIVAAIFHSRALGRDFVLARDTADLDALEARGLPVVFFGECSKLQHLAPADLGKVLDFRTVFGPSVRLEWVRPGPGNTA